MAKDKMVLTEDRNICPSHWPPAEWSVSQPQCSWMYSYYHNLSDKRSDILLIKLWLIGCQADSAALKAVIKF